MVGTFPISTEPLAAAVAAPASRSLSQVSRLSLMALPMRLYGSFAGKEGVSIVTADVISLENLQVALPGLASVSVDYPGLGSLVVNTPVLKSVEVQPG